MKILHSHYNKFQIFDKMLQRKIRIFFWFRFMTITVFKFAKFNKLVNFFFFFLALKNILWELFISRFFSGNCRFDWVIFWMVCFLVNSLFQVINYLSIKMTKPNTNLFNYIYFVSTTFPLINKPSKQNYYPFSDFAWVPIEIIKIKTAFWTNWTLTDKWLKIG